MNVLVIGGGMAGAAAALTARAAGASVQLISRGPGASALSSGAADIGAQGDAPLLEVDGYLGDLLGHGRIGLEHRDHLLSLAAVRPAANKKADVVEHPEVFDHVGLLGNEPPDPVGLPFLSSSDDIRPDCFRS